MSEPLHVVHGVLSLDVGGLERIVLSLIRAASQQGHRVSVVCIERRGALAVEAEAAGAKVVSLDKPPGRLPAYVNRAALLLAELKPDVVHTHQIGVAWYLGQAARSIGGVPVLHTEHGDAFARSVSWWNTVKARFLFRETARFIHRFCCVSEEIAAAVTRWRTVPRAKVNVVVNGIPTEPQLDLPSRESVRESLGIPAGVPLIGTVGRLSEVKQQDLLIRAVAKLRATIPDVRLLLVGEGPERDRLKEIAAQSGVADRVVFAGYQSCPEQYLRTMSVFALTSRSEGFPVSLLEAWLAKVPIVCSAVGGIPGFVTDEVDGLLFPPNDEASLTKALARVLEDPMLSSRLADAGHKVLRERYSIERMASEYEAGYRELVVARARGIACASWQ